MFELLSTISFEVIKIITQTVTGKLLTEDTIRKISTDTIGQYFTLPTSKNDQEFRKRIDNALKHIDEAGIIVLDLQNELHKQENQLNELISKIEEKRK